MMLFWSVVFAVGGALLLFVHRIAIHGGRYDLDGRLLNWLRILTWPSSQTAVTRAEEVGFGLSVPAEYGRYPDSDGRMNFGAAARMHLPMDCLARSTTEDLWADTPLADGSVFCLRSFVGGGHEGELEGARFAAMPRVMRHEFVYGTARDNSLRTQEGYVMSVHVAVDISITGSVLNKEVEEAFAALPGWVGGARQTVRDYLSKRLAECDYRTALRAVGHAEFGADSLLNAIDEILSDDQGKPAGLEVKVAMIIIKPHVDGEIDTIRERYNLLSRLRRQINALNADTQREIDHHQNRVRNAAQSMRKAMISLSQECGKRGNIMKRAENVRDLVGGTIAPLGEEMCNAAETSFIIDNLERFKVEFAKALAEQQEVYTQLQKAHAKATATISS